MTNLKLEETIMKCNLNKGKEILPNSAYLCIIDGYEIIVLTTNKKRKVGGILRCGTDDIHFTIFPKYRGKHYLSNFIKVGIMQQVWKENKRITITTDLIENIDDYNKKMHLAKLTGYKLINKKQLKEKFKVLKLYK